MPNIKAFGLNASDLNPFLFTCVGTEVNGSALTVLSVLARLGSDPWTEAGRLATLPRPAATDWLAERIISTPLTLEDINGAGATARAARPSPAFQRHLRKRERKRFQRHDGGPDRLDPG